MSPNTSPKKTKRSVLVGGCSKMVCFMADDASHRETWGSPGVANQSQKGVRLEVDVQRAVFSEAKRCRNISFLDKAREKLILGNPVKSELLPAPAPAPVSNRPRAFHLMAKPFGQSATWIAPTAIT